MTWEITLVFGGLPFGHWQDHRRIDVERIDQSNE
jgi:hypothetical protein